MEQAVQIFAAVNFAVIGLSHVLQPKVWVDFFAWLGERGEAGVFANAFLSLISGSIVVAFHNVWSGIPMALTIVGWVQVLKALIYLTLPAYGLRTMRIPSREGPDDPLPRSRVSGARRPAGVPPPGLISGARTGG